MMNPNDDHSGQTPIMHTIDDRPCTEFIPVPVPVPCTVSTVPVSGKPRYLPLSPAYSPIEYLGRLVDWYLASEDAISYEIRTRVDAGLYIQVCTVQVCACLGMSTNKHVSISMPADVLAGK